MLIYYLFYNVTMYKNLLSVFKVGASPPINSFNVDKNDVNSAQYQNINPENNNNDIHKTNEKNGNEIHRLNLFDKHETNKGNE